MATKSRTQGLFGETSPQGERQGDVASWGAKPLPEELRPKVFQDLELGSLLHPEVVQESWFVSGYIPSLLLWGPPGTGKTSLARLLKRRSDILFVEVSGLEASVTDLRAVIKDASRSDRQVVLFVDEIHRLTRPQQDALLAAIEAGTIILVGATTENPGFVVAPALLSRLLVLSFSLVSDEGLQRILARALATLGLSSSEAARDLLVRQARGDARRLLGLLERVVVTSRASDASVVAEQRILDVADVQRCAEAGGSALYSRSGDERYDIVSAFIKSLRGSDPDAALYWGFRMLAGGEEPRFLFRRLIIFASEDVGNADPRALPLAIAASEAFERVGLPEGEIPLAQVITFLATAPKSNRSYVALNRVKELVRDYPTASVPLHLRNAPTKFAKDQGHGADYDYPHDHPEGFVSGARYLPRNIQSHRCYEPSSHGYEAKIAALQRERELRQRER